LPFLPFLLPYPDASKSFICVRKRIRRSEPNRLWQYFARSQAADFTPLNDDWYLIIQEIVLALLIIRRFCFSTWPGVNLDLVLDKVDDPVDRNSGASINSLLQATVSLECGVRDFNHYGNVLWERMPF